MTGRRQLRVAIYTRKSSEEGLDQDFNSLDAQREACEAFIASQRELGWKALSDRYDDGGLSGGSMDRPALLRLLDEVKARRVDIIVVYKIDRLTRSLMDFSRIVETFDANEVSFVSVTQQFNTSTSMGRLTLNLLLSFAQFEREVTAERIRDKIAASKKKGMWMGGLVPLGYDAKDRKLVINREEARTIRWLFDTYLQLGSVRRLKEMADVNGIVSKPRRTSRTSDAMKPGVPLSRGLLYKILGNPIYRGSIRHGSNIYPGQHEAIIDEQTFDRVLAMLTERAPRRRMAGNVTQPHLLTGILFDETGDRMSPVHASKNRQRYRYYVSHRLMQARRREKDGWRLPAQQIEAIVIGEAIKLLRGKAKLLDLCGLADCDAATAQQISASGAVLADALEARSMEEQRELLQCIIQRVSLQPDAITIGIDRAGLANALGTGIDLADLAGPIAVGNDPTGAGNAATIRLPIELRRRGVEARLVLTATPHAASNADPNLIRLLGQAHAYIERLTGGSIGSITELADTTGSDAREVSRILPLAFLAPDIVRDILEGRQPPELTAEALRRIDYLPSLWKDQRARLGFAT